MSILVIGAFDEGVAKENIPPQVKKRSEKADVAPEPQGNIGMEDWGGGKKRDFSWTRGKRSLGSWTELD